MTPTAEGFLFINGTQGHNNTVNQHFTWAVRSGDVGAVPLPAAAWLFGSGLLALMGISRRK